MEVHVESDVQARPERMATTQQRSAETLAREAVQRLLDYDDWFVQEADQGWAAADRGGLLSTVLIRTLSMPFRAKIEAGTHGSERT